MTGPHVDSVREAPLRPFRWSRAWTRTTTRTTNAAANPTFTPVARAGPAPRPAADRAKRATIAAGLAQPWRPAEPVSGEKVAAPPRKGTNHRMAVPTAMQAWAATARHRPVVAARRATSTSHSTMSTAATTFTSAASVSRIVTTTSENGTAVRFVAVAKRAATQAAAATNSASSASLWPPPTVWTTTTGLRATHAAANAWRPGRTARAAAAPKAAAPSAATPAIARNSSSVSRRLPRAEPDTNALRSENTGPYTDRAWSHSRLTATVVGSAGNAAGACRYGFAPWSASILPYAA